MIPHWLNPRQLWVRAPDSTKPAQAEEGKSIPLATSISYCFIPFTLPVRADAQTSGWRMREWDYREALVYSLSFLLLPYTLEDLYYRATGEMPILIGDSATVFYSVVFPIVVLSMLTAIWKFVRYRTISYDPEAKLYTFTSKKLLFSEQIRADAKEVKVRRHEFCARYLGEKKIFYVATLHFGDKMFTVAADKTTEGLLKRVRELPAPISNSEPLNGARLEGYAWRRWIR